MMEANSIIAEMRYLAQGYKDSNDEIPRRHIALMLTRYADTIEAAVKALEADRDNWRKQALVEDARANEAQSVTNCNQQKDWRKICAACQEGEPPEDCEYFGEPGGCNAPTMGKHPTCKESLHVGNAAKMREVVAETEKSIDKTIAILEQIPETCGFAGILEDACDVLCYLKEELVKPALSAPPRNCDLYATEDEAWEAFCKIHSDAVCPSEYWSERYVLWLFAEAKGETK
jgi:hypothetical protein